MRSIAQTLRSIRATKSRHGNTKKLSPVRQKLATLLNLWKDQHVYAFLQNAIEFDKQVARQAFHKRAADRAEKAALTDASKKKKILESLNSNPFLQPYIEFKCDVNPPEAFAVFDAPVLIGVVHPKHIYRSGKSVTVFISITQPLPCHCDGVDLPLCWRPPCEWGVSDLMPTTISGLQLTVTPKQVYGAWHSAN